MTMGHGFAEPFGALVSGDFMDLFRADDKMGLLGYLAVFSPVFEDSSSSLPQLPNSDLENSKMEEYQWLPRRIWRQLQTMLGFETTQQE
ncbi:unnamed protein product [Notodromas monacha]|uniref:Uncharacterized protein n=1 Tax=Notodromas monacha TaxID=399045 RepID=A0A7R9C1Q3_9CRUS|nr:unnamed protein product [Notodromas monacha]CAG0924490.1 unnamed protein product [Notodromas monacha]